MRALTALILVLGVSGCAAWRNTHGDPQRLTDDQRRTANVWMTESVQDQSVENAIVRQHTVFPYHFIENSAKLNNLGTRDLTVLAKHFRDYPGPLNVRRDDAAESLYAERINTVKNFLEKEGVAVEEVSISDSPAGGDGMPSEQVVQILTESRERQSGSSSTRQTTGGNRVQQSAGGMRRATSGALNRTRTSR